MTGHTDAKGTTDYNLDLSQRRAQAVWTHLAERLQPAVGFTVEGRGEADPVTPNEKEALRADPFVGRMRAVVTGWA